MTRGLYGQHDKGSWTTYELDEDGIPKDNLPKEYLMLLGRLQLCAAALDGTLGTILDFLAKIPSALTADTIFQGESHVWKVAKCKILIDNGIDPNIIPENRDYLKSLLMDAQRLLDERGKYAHAYSWSYDENTNTMRASRLPRNKGVDEWKFTFADLKTLVGRIARTEKDLLDLIGWEYSDFADDRAADHPLYHKP